MPRIKIFPPKGYKEKTQREFYFWTQENARLPIFEDWLRTDLAESEAKELVRLLRLMSNTSGPRLHRSKEKFKHEFDKISAIKSFQVRLCGVLERDNFIILHFFKKKTDKLSKQDRKILEERYAQYRKSPH